MLKNYLILLMFCLGASNFMNAQTVTGTVSDDSSQPLPGVTIVVKGTTTGTARTLMATTRLQLVMETY